MLSYQDRILQGIALLGSYKNEALIKQVTHMIKGLSVFLTPVNQIANYANMKPQQKIVVKNMGYTFINLPRKNIN